MGRRRGTGIGAAVVLAALPGTAWADWAVNGAGNHATFADAQAVASPGDTITLDGVVTDSVSVTVDDLTIDGEPGAILRSSAENAVSVSSNLSVTIQLLRIERVGTTTRGINLEGGASLTLRDSTLSTGRGSSLGGGIYALGSAAGITVERVTFEGTAGVDRASDGGALYVSNATGPVTLTDVVFDHVEASGNGGAIYANNTDVTCTGCTFDHTAGANGGAIYTTGTGTLTVLTSLFCGTSATGNGGSVFGSSSGTIRGTRFLGSDAFTDGGAIRLGGGTWTVENNTLLGSAGTSVVYVGAGTAAFRNNLFRDNGGTTDIHVVSNFATITAMTYNWLDGPNRVVGHTPGANNNQTGLDAQLVQWTDNGDCTDDLVYPQWDSPLIDVGDPAILDPDGSQSDVGAYGGPAADPEYHLDGDGDGLSTIKDCDDADIDNYPSNDETCDGSDNDCDALIDDADGDVIGQEWWHPDCDGDGQGDFYVAELACIPPNTGCTWLSEEEGDPSLSDCNDADENTYLGADETCDPGDQNCDGDDDLGTVDGNAYYEDQDGDGYGDDLVRLCDFSAPPGYVTIGGDCNDNIATGADIYPGADDPCGDDIDQDCNGGDGNDDEILEWFLDLDEDGYGDDLQPPVVNCQDPTQAGEAYTDIAGDCDDTNADVNPDGTEVCNFLDDDCDGGYDNLNNPLTYYPDADADGFGDTSGPVTADCPPDTEYPWVGDAGDCDDEDDLVYPGAPELCNGVDDDCDDKLDSADDTLADGQPAYEDRDLDGYGACPDGAAQCEPTPVCDEDLGYGYALDLGDCDDTNPAQHPGQLEVPGNTVDEDCDGEVEPGRDAEPPDERGCNCDASGAPTSAGAMSALALLTLIRRRRQR